jgi:LysM repeat protein
MIQYKDKYVKLLLTGNIVVEGLVQEWDAEKVILLSEDNSTTSIITHPKDDIRVVKVINNQVKPVEVVTKKNTSSLHVSPFAVNNTELHQKFEETYDMPVEDDMRLQNLSQLKKELIKQDLKIIAGKIKSHTIDEVRKVNYDYPGFFKKQSSE